MAVKVAFTYSISFLISFIRHASAFPSSPVELRCLPVRDQPTLQWRPRLHDGRLIDSEDSIEAFDDLERTLSTITVPFLSQTYSSSSSDITASIGNTTAERFVSITAAIDILETFHLWVERRHLRHHEHPTYDFEVWKRDGGAEGWEKVVEGSLKAEEFGPASRGNPVI